MVDRIQNEEKDRDDNYKIGNQDRAKRSTDAECSNNHGMTIQQQELKLGSREAAD